MVLSIVELKGLSRQLMREGFDIVRQLRQLKHDMTIIINEFKKIKMED